MSWNAQAAVMRLVEGLRLPLAAEGVEVNVVCPGFVRSRMTAVSKYPMPMMWEADRAARYTAEGLAANQVCGKMGSLLFLLEDFTRNNYIPLYPLQEVICFPFLAYVTMAFLSILPSFLTKILWQFVAPGSSKTL
jgi:NAD(P)-dependent dehydrogenase (short-subunit alcohol dehydrogenase family)